MTIGQSAKSQLGWSKETTYGTYVSCTHPFEAAQVVTPALRANVQRIRQTGSSRSAAWLLTALKERSLSVETRVVDGRTLALALELMTQVATEGTSPYTHTISPDDHTDKNSMDSFSLEYVNPDLDTGGKYVGCMVNSLTLAGAGLDTPLTATFELLAKDVSPLTWAEKAAVTPHTTKPYSQAGCQLQLNDVNFDGAVDNFSFRMANSLQAIPDVAGASDVLKFCMPGNRDYDCSLTVKPNSKALWEALIASTDQVEASFLYTRAVNDTLEIVGLGEVLPDEGGLEHPAEAGPLNLPITLVMTKAKIIVVDSQATFYT